MYRLLLVSCLAITLFAEIPDSVMAEQNLEKRSELALKEADARITAASKAYADNDSKAFLLHVEAVGELAQFSLKSLEDSGKDAKKSPKYFKRAELKLRGIMRRLETLEKDVLAEDRPPVEKVKATVSTVHEQVLHDIMSKR